MDFLAKDVLTVAIKLDDAKLVERMRCGDANAFEVICHRYEKRLLRTATRITKNKEDAEDAVQEAFLKAYWRIDTFQGNSSFSTWLTSIVVNACLMQLRRRRLRPMVSLDEPRECGTTWMDLLPDGAADVETQMLERERSMLLSGAVAMLNPKLRCVLEDQQKTDSSLADVARRRGISLPAAKSRIVRARTALRESLMMAGAL